MFFAALPYEEKLRQMRALCEKAGVIVVVLASGLRVSGELASLGNGTIILWNLVENEELVFPFDDIVSVEAPQQEKAESS